MADALLSLCRSGCTIPVAMDGSEKDSLTCSCLPHYAGKAGSGVILGAATKKETKWANLGISFQNHLAFIVIIA
jgi:hypothetical protein